jgi:DNA repair protein RadC
LPATKARKATVAVQARFPGFAEAVTAPYDAVEAAAGADAANILTAVRAAGVALYADKLRDGDLIDNWQRLLDYLHVAHAHDRVEQFRVLFLDNRNRLIADEVLGQGTINHAPVYPREIVRRAVLLDATSVILVHNHPSGNPQPSLGDIKMTKTIKDALETVDVIVHDHLIVADSTPFSFRGNALL